PDFPTGGELVSPAAEIRDMYKSGSGTLRLRASYKMEGSDIVITSLPYQISGSKVLEQIASQMRAKKLPQVDDLRDESDHEEPTRLVISKKRGVDVDELMSHLYATTSLERTFRVNMNVIGLNGRPRMFNLLELLKEWITFRKATVKRRLEHRLQIVRDRLHILDGLLVAYLNIDEVIRIIRSEDEPKPVLMKKFKLSDVQAEAILNLRLRNLAKLEEIKIKGEQDELNEERDVLEKTLKSAARLKTLIKKEILEDCEAYGDDRRTAIVERDAAQALDETRLVASEPVTVVLSKRGYARAAKGHDIDPTALSYKSGDSFLASAQGRSNQLAMFIDSTGRVYSIIANTLPSARGQGEPLSSRFKPPDGAEFCGAMIGDEEQRYLLASDAGYGFVATLGDLVSRNKAGKAILRVPPGGKAAVPAPVPKDTECLIAAVSNIGRLLMFEMDELPELAKGKGNKLINIPGPKYKSGEERMVAAAVVPEDGDLQVYSGKRMMTIRWDDSEPYYGERALRGRFLPKGWRKVDRLAGVAPKSDE
ncbi:MAG: DNA topoisomerase IV subunit A, partial [Woeseiaceae bacterium]|nr:DNA topoisomerase IV subunit A [Woeseiaceae bacterium]